MLCLFKGEKTNLFWVGLLLLGFASMVLFSAIWAVLSYMDSGNFDYYIRSTLPPIVGSIVFILIGLYMMKSGIKKERPPT